MQKTLNAFSTWLKKNGLSHEEYYCDIKCKIGNKNTSIDINFENDEHTVISMYVFKEDTKIMPKNFVPYMDDEDEYKDIPLSIFTNEMKHVKITGYKIKEI